MTVVKHREVIYSLFIFYYLQRAIPDHTTYCASKGAVNQITRTMAIELGKYGIRTNNVNPTVVLTRMGKIAWSDPEKSGPIMRRIPLGRFAGLCLTEFYECVETKTNVDTHVQTTNICMILLVIINIVFLFCF